jgi:aerobic-type carbon monoxide dehydrogenase small subunit (CoxS/CutS family)
MNFSAAAPRGLVRLSLEVNGTARSLECEPRRTLVDALRGELGLTGTKRPCDMGNCGGCTVLLDDAPVCACLVLAVDCAGRRVTTIEAFPEPTALQRAFVEEDAFQCGFCTPGQIMALEGLFRANPRASDEEIVHALAGNLCRCGAYRNILRAAKKVRDAA